MTTDKGPVIPISLNNDHPSSVTTRKRERLHSEWDEVSIDSTKRELLTATKMGGDEQCDLWRNEGGLTTDKSPVIPISLNNDHPTSVTTRKRERLHSEWGEVRLDSTKYELLTTTVEGGKEGGLTADKGPVSLIPPHNDRPTGVTTRKRERLLSEWDEVSLELTQDKLLTPSSKGGDEQRYRWRKDRGLTTDICPVRSICPSLDRPTSTSTRKRERRHMVRDRIKPDSTEFELLTLSDERYGDEQGDRGQCSETVQDQSTAQPCRIEGLESHSGGEARTGGIYLNLTDHLGQLPPHDDRHLEDRVHTHIAARVSSDILHKRPFSTSEEKVVAGTVQLALRLFPEHRYDSTTHQRMVALASEAFRIADETYTMADAEEWGDQFIFPADTVANDLREYIANGESIQAMAEQRIKAFGASRLSNDRTPLVEVLLPTNPETQLLQRLASQGMRLMVDPKFVPNSRLKVRPPLRPKYIATKSAVNKLLFTNFYEKGLAVILPLSALNAGQDKESYHLSPLSWAPKAGTPKGRPIGDCSDGGKGARALNSTHTKTECDRKWGQIKHPTISQIATMVDHFLTDHPVALNCDPGDEVVIWKMDLKGAYTLLSFNSTDVPLLGMELTDDLVMFFLCGIFGWTGTPACFQVVTRAIMHELKARLRGRALMYVDDIFGVSKRRDLDHDLTTAKLICESMLGPDSVEDKKTESGTRLTVISYDIDINKRIVTVAHRNVLKALHGFLSIDIQANITVKSLQKLASWASRYGEVCRYMKPFNRALYSAYAGKRTTGDFPIPADTRSAILMFRVLLSLTSVLEAQFTRDLGSFKPDPRPSWVVEFDASLSGIGLLWYHRPNSEDPEVLLGGCSVDITSLGFGVDASYQNTAEFIAAALGVRGLAAFGGRNQAIEMRGDSITALTWSRKRGVRSPLASNASIFYAL